MSCANSIPQIHPTWFARHRSSLKNICTASSVCEIMVFQEARPSGRCADFGADFARIFGTDFFGFPGSGCGGAGRGAEKLPETCAEECADFARICARIFETVRNPTLRQGGAKGAKTMILKNPRPPHRPLSRVCVGVPWQGCAGGKGVPGRATIDQSRSGWRDY